MSTFTTLRDRDAWNTIRGYVYQVDLTIERWLNLQLGQTLELECGEDIDIVSRSLTATPDEQQRLLEQVKHRDDSITLKTPEAVTAIACFIEHRQSNPSANLVFRFTTNSKIGKERLSLIPNKTPAIGAWEQIRQGKWQAATQREVLEGIRKILNSAKKPDKLHDNTWQIFRDFITTASDDQLLDLICKFEWSTNAPEALSLSPKLQKLLIEQHATDNLQAQEQYQRLFLYVFKLLSQRGSKQLTVDELTQQLSLPPLSESDRQLLNNLWVLVQAIESRVGTLEQGLSQTNQAITLINAEVQRLAREQGIDASIRYTVTTPILDVPPSVKHLSSRAETVNNLTGLFSSHTWIAIHGSAGTGKTQLAILVVRACSVTTAWLRLRGLTTEQACVRLDAAWDTLMRSPSQMLVLDDIPRLLGGDEFSERLLLLANSCREKGVHLLSTSCYELPLNLRESLNVQTLYVMEIPLLNNQEASEMLLAYGAPPSLLTTKLVTFINGLAKQHPLLLAATARYLLQQNWQFTEDVLEGLFKSEYTAELNNETISRLLVTIEDTKTRELLYRLNLVQRHFSLDDMQAVASVKPIVERPRERLNTLIGLWVQRDDNNRLLVSPLVQALGSNDLLIETRKECHFLLGERIIRKKQLNQVDGMQALIHFCGAENFNRAGWLLISGLRSLMDLDVLVDDKGLLLLWSDQQLPEQMELTTRLFLRGLQIVVRHKYGMSISYLVEDLDALFRQASEKEAVAVVGVILLVDSLFSQYDPMCMNRYVRSALQLWSEIKMPDTGELLFPDGEPLEILIWTNLKQGIASFDHLRDWIYTLEHLTDGQRRRAFTDGFAELGCLIVSEDLYHKEEAKPRENQQWHIVFDALRELAERASQLEIKLLWACAVRTQIAVLGTNLNDIDAAVTAAEAVISQSDEPRIQLLIAECMGRQYFNAHRNSEALTWLNKAISQDTTSYPTVRLDALMLASRAVAPEDPDAALKYVQQAAKLAQSNDAISENTLVKTLGELAIARWLARDLAGAFEPWEQAAERLFACKTDSDDWKELFVVFSHVSGYLVSLACRGIPPTNTLDGGPYVAPERGFFFTHRPQMAARYNNSYDSFLTVHLADFAEATGDEEQAAKWALKGIEVARQTNQLTALPVLGTNAIPHLLLDSRYVEVLDFAIETGAILIASKQRFDAGMNALEPNLNVEALLGSKPNELWLRAERDAATMGLLPIVFRLATVAISQPELIQVQAQEVVAACQQVSAIAFDQVLWVTASELIEQIYLQQASFEELINRSNGFTPEHEILWAIGYLVASLQNKATPQSALMTHLYVTHYLYKWLTPSSATYRRIVLPFLLRYWTNTFEKTRFRFSTPRLIESELSEAQSIPETQRAQSILKTIASGLGVGIPSNFEQWLHGHILRA